MSPSPPDMADLGALAGLAPALATTFASIASDIALVIDADGVIRSVALGDAPISRQVGHWVGLPFIDTVTQGTRGKITQLLDEVDATGVSRRREVNLPGAEGLEIPVAFAAIRLGANGPVLAVGRDLRAIAAIQQRFVEAQQELERDYWRQRQAEGRYRLLFQVATDAVMVVDATSLTIVEANRAAAELFGCAADQLVGLAATVGIDPASRPAVDQLLVTARSTGRPAEIRARLGAQSPALLMPLVDVSATPFRTAAEGSSQQLLLVRVRSAEPRSGDTTHRFSQFVENTPDAVVITDSAGRVHSANQAFMNLCPAGLTDAQLRGRTLSEVLGDPSHRLAALVGEVRRNGIASHVRAPVGSLGGERAGATALEVEVSAALLAEGDQECIGFTLRRQDALAALPVPPLDGLVAAIETLAAQLGRVSLPELMQEATHVAERHLIQTALERSRGQVATAAAWLGITVDSLVLRLRRHGLAVPGLDGPPALLN